MATYKTHKTLICNTHATSRKEILQWIVFLCLHSFSPKSRIGSKLITNLKFHFRFGRRINDNWSELMSCCKFQPKCKLGSELLLKIKIGANSFPIKRRNWKRIQQIILVGIKPWIITICWVKRKTSIHWKWFLERFKRNILVNENALFITLFWIIRKLNPTFQTDLLS